MPGVTVLSGGVGAARFLRGLLDVVDPAEVTAVVNVGDDAVLHGLEVSPDLDTITYTLADAVDPGTGWGLAGETWQAMAQVRRYAGANGITATDPVGNDAAGWFSLGDRDLGTHLYRTSRIRSGATLTEVTAEIARTWGLELRVLPVTDDPLRTRVTTADGRDLTFQEYFVREHHDVAVAAVRFDGADASRPGPAVLAALSDAHAVCIAPSNPVVSIDPVLAVPGVREALVARRERTVAVSPIVGGAALKGPRGPPPAGAGPRLQRRGHRPLVRPRGLRAGGRRGGRRPGRRGRGRGHPLRGRPHDHVGPRRGGGAGPDLPGRSRRGDGTVTRLEIIPVEGIGEIGRGADLAGIICDAATLEHHDVVVVTQKVVSKAEGAMVAVDPDDPLSHKPLVERESVRILRRRGELIISETSHGFVCANAGIDLSNVDRGQAALLPEDPDRSARRIRDGIRGRAGVEVGVIVSDTFGRPWRRGVTDVAIGSAGLLAVMDLRGTQDAYGRELQVTEVAVVDELAAAAELVMGKSTGVPVAVLRGVDPAVFGPGSDRSGVLTDIVRSPTDDLFR